MYVYAFSNYTEEVEAHLSDKKALLTQRFNRTDNFINLALLGAQKCIGDRTINPQSSLYLVSRIGNFNATISVFEAIFRRNSLPMPFHFLNSVNASSLFFVAKNFAIVGKTLFVDRLDSAFPQAFVDVQEGKTVLLGVVEEMITDQVLRRKRFGAYKTEESRWLLLSKTIEGHQPIAKISHFQLNSSLEKHHHRAVLFDFLESSKKQFIYQGDKVTFKIEKCI